MHGPELSSFRAASDSRMAVQSRWRYLQFVVVGLLVAGMAKWLGAFGWLPSLAAGAVVGIAYLGFEKKRGVI